MKDCLLVTFPVDLGNRTIETNFHAIFHADMDFFRFAAQRAHLLDKNIDYRRSVWDRLRSIYPLRKALRPYVREKKEILFNGLSPAFLSFGAWEAENTALALDWTRALYPQVLGKKIEKNAVFRLHSAVLRAVPRILCWTDAIMENLVSVYGVDASQLIKVPAPLLVELFGFPPRSTPRRPRVLFIGGDLKRKGGDVLIEQASRIAQCCDLTFVSSCEVSAGAGISVQRGIRYGTQLYKQACGAFVLISIPTPVGPGQAFAEKRWAERGRWLLRGALSASD
jgi:hypothetical protein